MPRKKSGHGSMDASEFVAKLQADPEYLEQKAAVEAERQKLEREERRASAPLLRDLKRVGVEISSIWDLVNTAEPYTAALPILVKHLQQRRYPDMLRQGIARALAVRQSKFAWPTLLAAFRAEFDNRPNGVKWAIACALAAAADDEVISDVIALFQEPRHGMNRVAFVQALAKSKVGNARLALENGRNDPDVGAEIHRVLDRRKRRR